MVCRKSWYVLWAESTAKVVAAVEAGCTVVPKPSEVAVLTSVMLAERLDECGLPAGVFSLVTGCGPVATRCHPAFRPA